jgi:preprotein translocase subunit YajC
LNIITKGDMNMYLRKLLAPAIAVASLLLALALATFAHAGMEHVMGTVAAVTDNSITVDTVKHTKVTVLIDPSTKFIKNNAQALLKDLKVGDRVVIHAKRNPDKKLVGAEVKWGAGSMQMDKMGGMDHKH